jgi:hypothetical protein
MPIRLAPDAPDPLPCDARMAPESAGAVEGGMKTVIVAVAAAAATLAGNAALPLKPCTLPGFAPARCGRLAVREDRRLKSGRKIKLFVAVVAAYGPRPHREPIFYFSGGPGGAAASEDAAFASRILLPANRTRDLVLVDQRGRPVGAPALQDRAAVGGGGKGLPPGSRP